MEMRFGLAERWGQILLHERDEYFDRLARWKRGSLPRENREGFRRAISGSRERLR